MKGTLLILALALAIQTQAAEYDCGGGCDLGKLLSICKALEGDAQIKPFTTEIKCGGSQTYWETSGEGTFPLGTKQNVTSKISMKGGKYTLPAAQYVLAGAPTQGECFSYKELVGHQAPVSKILYSCAELEAVYKAGQAAYCKKVLSDSGTQLTEIKPTGKVYTNCPPTTSPSPAPHGGRELGVAFDRVKYEENGAFWYNLTVTSVTTADGLFPRLGMVTGDRISSVNGLQIDKMEELEAELDKGGESVTVIYFQKTTGYYVERTVKLVI